MAAATREPRFGFREHQVFWNQRGEVACACCHVPYPGSDTWVFERWEEITPAMARQMLRELGQLLPCECCGKKPSLLAH